MLPQIQSLIDEIATKPNWGTRELVPKVTSMGQSISQQMKNNGTATIVESSKKTRVELIKKYDILYLSLVGIPHYFLVHQIDGDVVYGVIFSSKNKLSHSIHEITNDRFFVGTYGTNSYLPVSLEEAKESFVRVFESRSEADVIFKKVKDHFKNVLKLK
jgi:hypothetical protein